MKQKKNYIIDIEGAHTHTGTYASNRTRVRRAETLAHPHLHVHTHISTCTCCKLDRAQSGCVVAIGVASINFKVEQDKQKSNSSGRMRGEVGGETCGYGSQLRWRPRRPGQGQSEIKTQPVLNLKVLCLSTRGVFQSLLQCTRWVRAAYLQPILFFFTSVCFY